MADDFASFQSQFQLSKQEICRELYLGNRDLIRIRKEHVATANLVRIIDSTLRLAAGKGFHAMSLRELSADTGLSIGGLYAYFRNKDDLLHLIQSHGFMLTRRIVMQSVQGVEGAREKLRTAVHAHVFLSELMLPWFYFSFMEARNLPGHHKQQAIDVEQEIEDIFFSIIRQGQEQGVFRTGYPRLLASMCKAMMQDWYLKRRKYRNQGVDVGQYAHFVSKLLERGLQVA